MSKYKLVIEFYEMADGEEICHLVKVPSEYDTAQEVVDAAVDFMEIYGKEAHNIKIILEVV